MINKNLLLFAIFLLFIAIFFQLLSSFDSKLILDKELNNSNESVSLDFQSCESLTGEKKISCENRYLKCNSDDCYYTKAKLENNEQICFNISDVNLRLSCSSEVNYDFIVQNAVILEDVNFCDKLSEDFAKLSCKNNFYYVLAFNKGDKSFCLNISNNEVIKNECLQ